MSGPHHIARNVVVSDTFRGCAMYWRSRFCDMWMKSFHPVISIDTSKTEVARAAIRAGASIVNDVTGGRNDEGMMALIAESEVVHRALRGGHDAERAIQRIRDAL